MKLGQLSLSMSGRIPTPTYDLTDGLIHHWGLEQTGSNNRTDSIVANAWDLVPTGSPGTQTGKYLLTLGAGTVTKTNATPTFDLSTTSFTLAFWGKAVSGVASVGFKLYGTSNTTLVNLVVSGAGLVTFSMGDESEDSVAVTENVSTGAWHLILGSWNHTTKVMKLWVDNSNTDTATLTDTIPTPSWTALNSWQNLTPTANLIADEFMWWNKILSTDEMTYLYNSGTGRFYPSFL